MAKVNVTMKKQIQRHLSDGKAKLVLLEHRIMDQRNLQKLKNEFEKSKKMFSELKEKFNEYEKKAVHYIEENPKKSMAMASAAGLLVGSLWASSRKKKKA